MRPRVNELDELLEAFTRSLVRDVEALPEAPAPFGQRRLSREEQLARYVRVRNDPGAWQTMLQDRGVDEVVRYARIMERRVRQRQEVWDAGA